MKPIIDYTGYFDNRVLIIGGVGRSGTTILGKLVGSMQNVVYLFEPAIMKYLLMLWQEELPFPSVEAFPEDCLKQTFLGLLFEDYIVPAIQGRNLSLNPDDWTYYKNYLPEKEWKARQKLSGRKAALGWIKNENPLFVIKSNEIQNVFGILAFITFQHCKFIHIIRNGFDVISSSIARGWFGDDYQPIEFGTGNVPIYIDKFSRRYWPDSTPITRAACAWRCLVNEGIKVFQNFADKFKCLEIRYEELCINPARIMEVVEVQFGLQETPVTKTHIENAKVDSRSAHKVNLEDIGEPERYKFADTMVRLGYLEEVC